MYLWHVPALYDAAAEHAGVHLLEHASFFAAGIALWWPLIQPVPMRRRLTGLQPLAYIGGAKAGLAALGLYLAWSSTALYPYYEQTPRIWGLTPVEDQNVGGVIMMVEQSFTLVLVMVALFVRMLTQSEEEQRRRERLEERHDAAQVRGTEVDVLNTGP
jgi:putative membrane protein